MRLVRSVLKSRLSLATAQMMCLEPDAAAKSIEEGLPLAQMQDCKQDCNGLAGDLSLGKVLFGVFGSMRWPVRTISDNSAEAHFLLVKSQLAEFQGAKSHPEAGW